MRRVTKLLLASALLPLLLSAGAARAQANSQCVSDSFEPNETCATAVPLTPGHTDASLDDSADRDYYSLTVPAGEALYLHSISDDYGGVVDLAFQLYAPADCDGTVLVSSTAWGTVGNLYWENTSAVPQPVILRIVHGPNSQSGCVNYFLDISFISADCQAVWDDDSFEVNDYCAQAAIVGDGLHSDLYISPITRTPVSGGFQYSHGWHSFDYYKLSVLPGQTLTVDIDFDHAAANLDLFVSRGLEQCEGLDPEISGDDFVASGQSLTDGESALWINDTGVTWTVFVQVRVTGVPLQGCGLYDLRISRFDSGIGTPFCFGDGSEAGVSCPCSNASTPNAGCKNSQGHGAILTASGTTNVANDDLQFSVTNAIPNQPFVLLQGATSIATPFKSGILCTGNPTRRMEVVFLDSAGLGTTVESVVTNGAVAPGQTRFYQAWYRDPLAPAPCTERSNLTQALELSWH